MHRPNAQHLTLGHLIPPPSTDFPSPTTPSPTATTPASFHTPMASTPGTLRRALSEEDARSPVGSVRSPQGYHGQGRQGSSSGSSPSSYKPSLPLPPAPPETDAQPTLLASARIKLSSRDQEAMRKLRSTMMEQSFAAHSDSGGPSCNSAAGSPSSPRFPPGTGAGTGYPPAGQGQGKTVRPRRSTLSRQVMASPEPGSTSGSGGEDGPEGAGERERRRGRREGADEGGSEEEDGGGFGALRTPRPGGTPIGTPVPEIPPPGNADYTIAVLGHEGTGKTTFIARALKTWGMSNPVKIYSAGGHMVSSCYSQIAPSGKLPYPRKVEFLEMNVQALGFGSGFAQAPSDSGTGAAGSTSASTATTPTASTATAVTTASNLWPGSIGHVSGAIYCYDAGRSETLQGLQECLAHLAAANIPTVLLACKSDPLSPSPADSTPTSSTRVSASHGNSLGEPYNVGLIEVTTKTAEGKAKMKNALRWLLYKLEQRQRRQQRLQLETLNIAQALSSSTSGTGTGNGVGTTSHTGTTTSGLTASTGTTSTTATTSTADTASTAATTATGATTATTTATTTTAPNLESLASPNSDGDSAGAQLMWRQKGLTGLTKRVEEGREEGSERTEEDEEEEEEEDEVEEVEGDGEEKEDEEVKVEGEEVPGEGEAGKQGKGMEWLAGAVGGEKKGLLGGEKLVKTDSAIGQGVSADDLEYSDPPIYLSLDELMNQLFTTIVTNRDNAFTRTFFMTYRRFCQPRELMHEFLDRFKEVEGYAVSSDVKHWALMKLAGALIDWTTSYPGDLVTPQTAYHFADIISLLLKHTFMAHLLSDLITVQHSLPDIIDLDQSWSRRPADAASHTSTAGTELVIDSEVLYDFDSVKSAEGQGDGEGDEDSARGGRMGSLGRKAGSMRSAETSSLTGSDPKAGVVGVFPVPHDAASVSSEERPQPPHDTNQQQQPQKQAVRPPRSASVPRGPNAAPQPGLALAGEDMADARWGAAVNMVLRMDQRAFATELTRMQWELFAAIRPRDVFRHDFGKETSGPVGKSIMFFNHVSRWVSTIILASHKAKHRARVIERFISIAHHLRRLNNYESLYALISGMRETSIHRLAATHALVQFANNDDDRHFQSHLKLMDARGGYVHYRRALQADISHGRGAIPLLTTILGLVSRMQAVRPEDVRKEDGKVQWDKFLRYGEILGIIQECQAKGPIVSGPVEARFKRMMEDTAVISNEDGLWERSQMLEHSGVTMGGKMLKRLANLGFSS
ncbi:hypothetical protein IAT38_004428 [Cryptococcus sp. DSM 104549]